MILVAIGANMSGPFGSALDTVRAVPELLARHNVLPVAASHIYATQPVGVAGQNPYCNSMLSVRSARPPQALLMVLKDIERTAGRTAGLRWGPRVLDLDLIAYHDRVLVPASPPCKSGSKIMRGASEYLILPHPRAHLRPFVMRPLVDIAPNWLHPILRQTSWQIWRRLQFSKPGAVIKDCGPLDIAVPRPDN